MSAIMRTYKQFPVAFVRGQGATLWDVQGRPFLDGLSGIAVTNLGHCHPRVTQAIEAQASQLVHTSNLFRIPGQEQLGAELISATEMESVFFCNSGAEANEVAIKLARRYGHDRDIKTPTIVVLDRAFHGRTLGALAATAGETMRQPFEPMVPGFIRIAPEDFEGLKALEAEANIVAVLVEPVQGEGGVRPLSREYLQALRSLCDRQSWLLMFDEVQTGNGRCGALYAYQRLGVTPDVLITAKGLGNGFPIGACLAKGEASTALQAGDHGTTYGGSPLACAAASAVVNTLANPDLLARADVIREHILQALHGHLANPTRVTDIRGLGLMLGIEVAVPAMGLVAAALEQGVVINVTAGNTIRLLPPLVMTNDEAKQLGHSVAEIINQAPEIAA
ncbi:aspartate aminotransferase family protein [Luminiphilus sp. nBUS_07]|uniref:aspartate aminotransferase family protein n=1 Tax=Luminiphilus sp. nBUS_07 TaxID=3395314 RepID=UPI003EBE83D2